MSNKKWKYSDAKKFNCVFCDSPARPSSKLMSGNGRKRIAKVRCSNPECESPNMTVKEWILRGEYYRDRDNPESTALKNKSPASIVSTRRNSLVFQLATNSVNFDTEKENVKHKNDGVRLSYSVSLPDWFVLGVRYAVEFTYMKKKDIAKISGKSTKSISSISTYNTRTNLKPTKENEKDWLRIVSGEHNAKD